MSEFSMSDNSEMIISLQKKMKWHKEQMESLEDAISLLQGEGAPASLKRRKEELREFLLESGPLGSTEIVIRTGIPRLTVNRLLKQENGFIRIEGAKWALPEHLVRDSR